MFPRLMQPNSCGSVVHLPAHRGATVSSNTPGMVGRESPLLQPVGREVISQFQGNKMDRGVKGVGDTENVDSELCGQRQAREQRLRQLHLLLREPRGHAKARRPTCTRTRAHTHTHKPRTSRSAGTGDTSGQSTFLQVMLSVHAHSLTMMMPA